MWYAKLTFRRLAVRIKDNRLGARIEVRAANAETDTPQSWVQSPQDTVYLSDVLSPAINRELTLGDTLGLQDAAGSAYGYVLTLEDSANLTEALAFDAETYLDSSVTLDDAQDLSTGEGQTLQPSDTVNLSDASALAVTLKASDPVAVNDSVILFKGFALSLQDSVTLDDALTRQLVLTLGHSVALTDSASKNQTLTLQGTTNGYVDPGYFDSDYVESAGGDLVFVTESAGLII